jgi:RNA-directed DNA polymerase
MGKLLQQAASPENLNQAWRKFRNDKAFWAEGISRADMEPHFVYHMTKLSNELASGTYNPGSVRIFPVAKADGKKRIISALTLRDKVAQRTVLSVLNPIGEKLFHQDSFGYRPGRSIDLTIARVNEHLRCDYIWLVDADIQSFFDEIPHKLLFKRLKKTIPDHDIYALLVRWLEIGSPRTGILQKRKGIPQGGVLSPFFCNVYLTELDNYLSKNNLPFVRFADDFLVFTKTKKAAERAYPYVQKGLKRLDLMLHPDKTRIVKSGPGVTFLGRQLSLNGKKRKPKIRHHS